ncbi:MAG: response regulator [Candidatus Omnitrophota bacterium]
MKLLVIDDSPEILEIVRDIFEPEGYTVITSGDSFQALELLAKHSIDCVILDLVMPILEGTHLISIMHEKYAHVPVIVLSGHIDNEQELIKKGAYAVIRKPPVITSLITTVENAIHDAKNSITFVFHHTQLKQIKDTVTARLIALALKKCKGNQLKAARVLGISRQCLIRYMNKYKLAVH